MINENITKVAAIVSAIAFVLAFLATFLSDSLGISDKTVLIIDGACLAGFAFSQSLKGIMTGEIMLGPIRATFNKEKDPHGYWIAISLEVGVGLVGLFIICWQIF